MFLTDDEVHELTHRVRGHAQSRVLKGMGIQHRMRPDGSIAVLRAHVDKEMGGAENRKPVKTAEPNWGAMRGA